MQIRRLIAASYGIGLAIAALVIWQSRHVEAFAPLAWTIWFSITAGVCLAFATQPNDPRLWRWSGALVAAAITSRLGGVLLNIQEGTYSTSWRGVGALVWITAAAWGARVTWHHLLRPART